MQARLQGEGAFGQVYVLRHSRQNAKVTRLQSPNLRLPQTSQDEVSNGPKTPEGAMAYTRTSFVRERHDPAHSSQAAGNPLFLLGR